MSGAAEPVDMAAERAARNGRHDAREAVRVGTRKARESLGEEVHGLLVAEPEISGAEAYRRLDPGIGYVAFMHGHFSPAAAAIRGTAAPADEPAPQAPAPEGRAIVVPAAGNGVDITSNRGRVTARPTPGGGMFLVIELRGVSERNVFGLIEKVRPFLFPGSEVDRG